MKNLSANAYHQYWQPIDYIYRKSNLEWIVGVSGSVPGEILIYLDLFFLLAVDAPSVRASIFSRSRLFSFSLSRRANARAHTHTYRHGVMRTSECEHLFHFIWKRERRWIKNRFIFFFSPPPLLLAISTFKTVRY